MVTYDPIKHIILFEEEPKRTRFRLDKIELLVCNSQIINIDLSRQNDSCDGDTLCQFSLLIGVNGVGKTTILRSIVDFFIDFHEYYNHDGYRITTRKNIQVVGVKYQANGNTYHVYKNENEKKFYVNDSDILNQKIPIPNIVASCFSVFDKFPIKNTMSYLSTSRYNVPFYTYVGARAANNTFSASSSLFHMLYNLLSLEKVETILKVRDILKYMGYDDRMRLTCKFRQLSDVYNFKEFVQNFKNEMDIGTPVSRRRWYIETFLFKDKIDKQKVFLTYQNLCKQSGKGSSICHYDFQFNQSHVQSHKDDIRNLYLLKQLRLITQTNLFLYKKGEKINCLDISSGELNMFCTVVGALSASEMENALILLDEPEISQHPNWQMSIIDFLNNGLKESPCHLLIATHSHFLVSDLPRKQSTVTYLNKTHEGLVSERIKEDTYGWSAEEVLLKVFKVPTTRNIYLAKIVGEMLDKIAKGEIEYQEVADKVEFLEEVLPNMSDVDPMKKIITTIVNTFNHEK